METNAVKKHMNVRVGSGGIETGAMFLWRRVREGFRRQALLEDGWQVPRVVHRKMM